MVQGKDEEQRLNTQANKMEQEVKQIVSPSNNVLLVFDMFWTHPDINTARMTFNHQPSMEWEVYISLQFNL